jgi:2-oxoglutarate dehydrogenase E2 component (dihydrolipoamide succinyltransferase)
VEVNAPQGGHLASIAADEGAEVDVGALLGTLEAGAGAASPAAKPSTPASGGAPAKPGPPGAAAPAPPAPVRAQAPEPPPGDANPPAGVHLPPAPTGPVSRPAPSPEQSAAEHSVQHEPLPAAAKMMEEQSVQAGAIGGGSGKDGRITKGDVLDFLARAQATQAAPAPAPAPGPAPAAPAPVAAKAARTPAEGEERVKMTRLRRTIAARLKEAQNTAAMLTTFNEVDMSAAMALRSEYREAFEKRHGTRLGYMGFFVRACCAALKEFPAVNAEIDGDEIVYKHHVHMGIAVGGSSGLVVPVIRHADQMSLAEIEQAVASYGKRARDGALKLDELTGGSFSITNGGVYGSLMSTPILNPPQSAILGMHKIQDRPIAVSGRVEIRPMMYLALSYDHRIVDGKEAVSFLVRVKESIEDPRRLLLDI